jgi:hypothetical protein
VRSGVPGPSVLRDRCLLVGLLLAAAGPIRCTAFKDDPSTDPGPPLALAEAGAESSLGEESSGSAGEAGGSCDVNRPFGPAVPALRPSGAFSATGDLRLSYDYLTGYFTGTMRDGTSSLFVTTRSTIDESFGTFGILPGMGLPRDVAIPTVTGDGFTLVFARSPNGIPSRLHWATRSDLSAPFEYAGLMPTVNDPPGGDASPFFREDGQALYFASSRVTANHADIYRSGRDGQAFQLPVAVDELNTPSSEIGPAVTPDDLTIYFASDRVGPDARGDLDIYVATRVSKSERFSQPRAVTELNSPDAEIPSFVTRDNCTLYFHSNRDRVPWTIYVATRPAR